jgi:hypothetical protein
MNCPSTVSSLGNVDDDDLKHLAVSWRAQALRGDREAYGVAHALEVEHRRRLRNSQGAQLQVERVTSARPWWKFWTVNRTANHGPMSST